jgi:hypothetical protein
MKEWNEGCLGLGKDRLLEFDQVNKPMAILKFASFTSITLDIVKLSMVTSKVTFLKA